MSKSLRQLHDDDHAVATLAHRMPRDFKEAVSYYLSERKDSLVAGIETVPAFEARERSYRIGALKRLVGVLDAKDIPAGKKIPKAKKGEDTQVYLSQLARILTPAGWQNKYGKKYEELIDHALSEILEQRDIEQNQAIMTEARAFLRYLSNVERSGKIASAEIQRGHLRRIENA